MNDPKLDNEIRQLITQTDKNKHHLNEVAHKKHEADPEISFQKLSNF